MAQIRTSRMTDLQRRRAAKRFAAEWSGRGREKQDTHPFWTSLLRTVLGVENAEEVIQFEEPVPVRSGRDAYRDRYIDALIPETGVLIEQKSAGVDLRRPAGQADGLSLTPFEQAKRYWDALPAKAKPRWIVVSNFQTFEIYDMDEAPPKRVALRLEDLENELHRLEFLVDARHPRVEKETRVSLEAGELVGRLYDLLLAQYRDPSRPDAHRSLNRLCVRLVFCLYGDDACLFGERKVFHRYLEDHRSDMRQALLKLFRVLDQRPEERDPYEDEDVLAFPYVNGGLFADQDVTIPRLSKEIADLLLDQTSGGFDWSGISPVVFGSVFEGTLNPETRRKGGMHYTSVENIHKVIDPLFLNDLTAELDEIAEIPVKRTRTARLKKFQEKLGQLTFLDPACGSGNFLTETYRSLRRLENQVISLLHHGQIALDTGDLIQVSIGQLYGIEINDFAVTVARTALWIAECQMMRETEAIVQTQLELLPLKSFPGIVEGNALRMDWEDVVPKNRLNYIIGNPPFVGARIMDRTQKADVLSVFSGWRNAGELDYVSCWYKKSSDMMRGTDIRAALVSTNSVTQGQSVPVLWKPLFEYGVHIDFAYRTFRWTSGTRNGAHVHCVIIGFSMAPTTAPKVLYTPDGAEIAQNINAYLVAADSVFVESRSRPICHVPEIGIGNKPIDGGHYLFTQEEMDAFCAEEPEARKWFRPWYGAREFINRSPRYCLWLGECPPDELHRMPECMKRVKAVRRYRMESRSPGTVRLADSPTRFHVENMPKSTYIVVPEVSSEKRCYVPMGFMEPDAMCSNLVKIVPDATLYHFGVLESSAHMAWMRAVAGRLETRYRYSKEIVYNNFPWPDPTPEQERRIERTAQRILDARDRFPNASLADLYDDTCMPPELRDAHRANDQAVLQAYGFPKNLSEPDTVAQLMRLYKQLS